MYNFRNLQSYSYSKWLKELHEKQKCYLALSLYAWCYYHGDIVVPQESAPVYSWYFETYLISWQDSSKFENYVSY